ncbi:MAG: EamA family transporter RarD [Kurthia sp.]|nr:EamA family transporter RarD [Candidatus Kurthia equi]
MDLRKKGIIAIVLAYLIWGIIPIYWKQLTMVGSDEIIISRIIWSFVLTVLFIIVIGQWKFLMQDIKLLWQHKSSFWSLVAASYLISLNWYIFIWAVNNEHIIETSMGYYINPLVSILLGVIFLKERLSKAQVLACFFALIGVLVLVIANGKFPFVALSLALSFGLYGLLKKKVRIQPTRGLAIETFFILPVALIYYIYLIMKGEAVLFNVEPTIVFYLIGTGVVTAVPLILFAVGAQNIPLYLVGFFQYIAPTMTLILGALVYGEQFGGIELLAFSFIWLAIIIFSYATLKQTKKLEIS